MYYDIQNSISSIRIVIFGFLLEDHICFFTQKNDFFYDVKMNYYNWF